MAERAAVQDINDPSAKCHSTNTNAMAAAKLLKFCSQTPKLFMRAIAPRATQSRASASCFQYLLSLKDMFLQALSNLLQDIAAATADSVEPTDSGQLT